MRPIRFAKSCREAAREREMRPEQFGVVSRLAAVLVVVPTCVLPVGTLPHGPAFGAAVVMAAQDAASFEAALGLDRPTRRLIQQGLGNEGFNPEAPDGLFGPRTRASAPAAPAPAPVAAPDAGLSTSATDTRSTATPDTAAPLAVESSGVPARASRPGQLPPEILIDRRLVRVDRLLARDDHRATHDVMNEVLALQREHAVALPAELHFKYAQVAFAAGLPETAVESLND